MDTLKSSRNVSQKSLKQRVGAWLIPRLPFGPFFFTELRFELRAIRSIFLFPISFKKRKIISSLEKRDNLLVNLGCGPFGLPGWVNIDLTPLPGVTLTMDVRRKFPLSSGSCAGIHVEHFFEHLDPLHHQPRFLRECHRALRSGGVLRLIVPDAEAFLRAYLEPGWAAINGLAPPGTPYEGDFLTKMQAINHVFVQNGEHFGGIDEDTLTLLLRDAGFSQIMRREWGHGAFPGGCIDRSEHQTYSIYIEAIV